MTETEKVNAAVLAVARQAVEYLGEKGGHPHFLREAKRIVRLATAIQKGREVGEEKGWTVIEWFGEYFVQNVTSHDEYEEAIRLARTAGVLTDDDGRLVDEGGEPLCV